MSSIEFLEAFVDRGDGRALERAMVAEMDALYGRDGGIDAPDMPLAGAEQLNPPNGRFVVGYQRGVAVCCGGIKRLEPGVCEFKRMYVVPAARGKGVARALLSALEGRARDLGFTVARLDTGPSQPAARHLYESAGYAAIRNFNANPMATFFGEKRL